MNIEQKRAAFEAWLRFSPLRMEDGEYADPDICEDWRVWQAALASPEVQALYIALKEVVDTADEEGWSQLDPTFEKQRAALAAMEKLK